MRKLAFGLVSILAIGAFLVACSDDSGSDASPGEGIKLDGGGEGVIIPEGGADLPGGDTIQPADCDPAFLGKICEFKACTTDADCAGVGTGKCDPSGVCEDAPCGQKNTCLTLGENEDGSPWGICTCHCTPDDPNTPLVVEDSCPDQANHTCSSELSVTMGSCTSDADCTEPGFTCQAGRCTGDQAFCLKYCDPKLGQNTCDGKLSCDPRSGPTWGIFDKAVCTRKGCTDNEDCPVDVGTTCDVKTENCATGQQCLVLDIRGDGCTADTDCDTDYVCKDYGSGQMYCTYKEGRCSAPGVCDTASGLCDKKPATLSKATAKVGDPCQSDKDCADNQSCLWELDFSTIYKKAGQACAADEECCSDTCTNGTCAAGEACTTYYRNGYCAITGCSFGNTLTIRACPADADCNTWYSGGMCQKKCTVADATSCRGNANDLLGDYECRDFSNIQFSGAAGAVTSGPVCDFGTAMGCAIFSGSTLDCSSFGDMSNQATPNPTNMSCRGLDNAAKSNKFAEDGYCLDDTASGTQQRNPLPTP